MIDAKVHVLVVDDEPDLCWAITQALRPLAYIVKSATSAAQALIYLSQHTYKVAFVDVKIQDMDGLKLASLIRQRSPATRIILISGFYYQEDSAIIEGLKNNLFTSFLAKPFNLAEVRSLAQQAVSFGEL